MNSHAGCSKIAPGDTADSSPSWKGSYTVFLSIYIS
jgi:hypothetical protein